MTFSFIDLGGRHANHFLAAGGLITLLLELVNNP